jgi:uncharacterized protein
MKNYTEEIKEFVEDNMDCAAHGLDHVMRVHALCLKLSEGESVDLEVLEAAALLHDIATVGEQKDSSGKTDHAIEGAKVAEKFLKSIDFPKEKINHVSDCIVSHRFRSDNRPKTLEAKILFDADKLETIGAIGIARTFAWIGKNGAHIYRKVDDIEEYAKENLGGKINGRIQDKTKHSIQIQYETKERFILEKLYTKKAKEFGKERMKFHENFLNRLENEVKGLC